MVRQALAMVLVVAASPAGAGEPARDLVARVAEVYARDVAGTIGFRSVLGTRIRSPVFNRHTYAESWTVMQDGIPVRTRILQLRIDGQEADGGEIEKQEARTNAQYREGKGYLRPPFDRRYLAGYDFHLDASGSKARSGLTAIRFSGRTKDEHHGSGYFTIDRHHRVHEALVTPAVLPRYVDRGSYTILRQEVGDGMFGVKSLMMKYEGSMGPLRGDMVLELDYRDYRRFPSAEEALSAIGTP